MRLGDKLPRPCRFRGVGLGFWGGELNFTKRPWGVIEGLEAEEWSELHSMD